MKQEKSFREKEKPGWVFVPNRHSQEIRMTITRVISARCLLSLIQAVATMGNALEPEQIGHHQFFVDSERYRFGQADLKNSAFYPIPNETITRNTYLQILEGLDLNALAANPNRGEGGLGAFMPVLAKYVESGEERWADACVEMLKHYQTALIKRVGKDKWIWDFECIPFFRSIVNI